MDIDIQEIIDELMDMYKAMLIENILLKKALEKYQAAESEAASEDIPI